LKLLSVVGVERVVVDSRSRWIDTDRLSNAYTIYSRSESRRNSRSNLLAT